MSKKNLKKKFADNGWRKQSLANFLEKLALHLIEKFVDTFIQLLAYAIIALIALIVSK